MILYNFCNYTQNVVRAPQLACVWWNENRPCWIIQIVSYIFSVEVNPREAKMMEIRNKTLFWVFTDLWCRILFLPRRLFSPILLLLCGMKFFPQRIVQRYTFVFVKCSARCEQIDKSPVTRQLKFIVIRSSVLGQNATRPCTAAAPGCTHLFCISLTLSINHGWLRCMT